MKIDTIDLYGKSLFTKVSIDRTIQMPTPMPEDEAGFVYVLKGRCINHSEIEQLDIQANQAVLAKSGNSIFKTVPHNHSDEYEAVSIRFHKDILSKLYSSQSTPFYEQNKSPLKSNSVLLDKNPLIDTYAQSILPYFTNKELLTEEILTFKIKELITLLLSSDHSSEIVAIMSNLFEKKTFEFREVIHSHILSAISINELAQLTYMSLSSFKKEFKRVFNSTPQKYILDKRIERAAESLQKSTDTISNIAYACQFQTLAHMSRVFKSKYGISPSEYRKNFSDK
ncbi:MAG: AraC family transcriptional regulator [bacterium]|nr:AraC family transcriptional regulator [bacterium]